MKVLFVATVVQKHIMEFHVPYLKMFKEHGWETAVAARNDYDNPADCHIPYCDHYYDIPFERSPFKTGNIKAYKELKKVIDDGHYDIVHCHTPVGAALTRLAAEDARKKGSKVFYTAHGFHFYDGAPLVNWLTYYPVEKYLARKTDVLITINKEDYNRAKKFKAGKVVYVPGVGIDLSKFESKPYIRNQKRQELGFKEDDFLLLSVGELIERKNHRVVLEAIARLKGETIYEHLYYLICGIGVLEDELNKLASDLGIEDHVHFLGYRHDISDLCNAADVFVFMSHQEGLPVALMEAMACGLPAICSKIRGNTDLIEDGKNGLFAKNDPEDVSQKIEKLVKDPELRRKLSANALQTIKHYDLSSVEDEMMKIYKSSENLGGYELNEIIETQKIRKEYGIPLDAIILLSVGEVNTNKNHRLVIEALGEIRNLNLYYIVVGKGPLIKEERSLAESLGVKAIFTGYRNDVKHFYRLADVFVFPSLREGLSLSMMEAMASGLPCVASRIRGNEDLLQGGQLLFTSNDVDDLAKKIRRALDLAIAEKEVEHNNRNIKNFSIENTTKKLWKFYKGAMNHVQ